MDGTTTADLAYANADFIPDGAEYPARWAAQAAAFREAVQTKELDVPYGPLGAQTYDMFHPDRLAKGTVIFVHGGYWLRFGPKDFSHLAAGALQAGYACALPRYTLAPAARISEITSEIALAVTTIAQRTTGPLFLVGHSAGGHLVARMACADQDADWTDRLRRVMSISPVSDLGPLMETSMNADLRIDADEARSESPALLGQGDTEVTVWVGADERPVFLDQARWLAEAWGCDHVIEKDRHHFDVIEGLETPNSPMMQALFK